MEAAMRKSIIILFLLISVTHMQCADNPLSNTQSTIITPDIIVKDTSETIVIGYDRTLLIEEENLLIKFKNVVEGRCPIGVHCFWEGQAICEFLLIKPDEAQAIARPIIRPGQNPDSAHDLADDALGYRLILFELNPYPDIDNPFDLDDYVAKLRVQKLPEDHCQDSVCFTWRSPSLLQKDPVTIQRGEIHEDTLRVTVSFSGGCGNHEFKFYMQPTFMESFPVQANLYLQHSDLEDPCDAIISENLDFDIRLIAELYKDMYGGYDKINLNIYGHFVNEPNNKIILPYTPQ